MLACSIPEIGYHIDANGLILGSCSNQTNCMVHESRCIVNTTILECNTAREGYGVLNGFAVVANESCVSQQHCVLDGTACVCLLYTSPSPRDMRRSRMPSSA